MTTQTDDETDGGGSVRRREVLTLLGALSGGVLVAETAQSDSHGIGVSFGGNPRESAAAAHRYGGISVAPQTIPPEGNRLLWSYNDDLGVLELRAPDPLPASWSANGLGWGAATTLSEARNQAGVPGAALVFQDNTAFIEWQIPDQDTAFTSEGVEIVMAGAMADAESTWSGATPAVLVDTDGVVVVIVDG